MSQLPGFPRCSLALKFSGRRNGWFQLPPCWVLCTSTASIRPIHLLTRAGMQPCDTPNSPETQGKSRLIMVDHHQSHRDGLCISHHFSIASLEPLSFLHAFGTAFLASFTDASIESTWDIAPNQRLSKLGVRKSTRKIRTNSCTGIYL